MSDPRFARLKTDPRFRRIKKDKNRVVVDDRFKQFFDDKGKEKNRKGKARVDKYGRPLGDDHEQDNLRRFYRMEDQDEAQLELKPGPDYARGEVLLESSDEEDDHQRSVHTDQESDYGGIITLGRDVNQPIPVPDDAEVDLDEDTYADLDAQAAAYAQANPVTDQEVQYTRRIAVVNLDWDHVRARHIYKIFASLVSPTGAPVAPGSKNNGPSKKSSGSVARGKVLSVRVYPSEFGKDRMAREEKEGPPSEIFKKKRDLAPEEINERTVYEVGNGEDHDEDALRKYQLERLRYYYAIVECDTVEAASHVFNELEGTELERSANILDLSFVPDGMTFDDDFRDEAKDDLSAPYKPLEFVTDALRHSKVKLTWDEDDPDRGQVTRRVLSRKEIEENDFRAYIASSSSEESEPEAASAGSGDKRKAKTKAIEREKLRALLLGGGDDTMPEGWGAGTGEDESNIDMEITFTPGLTAGTGDKDETTLEKYQRKMKEKKKKRKEEELGRRQANGEGPVEGSSAKGALDDDFFGGDSDEGSIQEDEDEARRGKKGTRKDKKGKGKSKDKGDYDEDEDDPGRVQSTAEELALLAASDNPNGEVKHFDMKAVLRAEKRSGKKKGRKGKKRADDGENELQDDFAINVKDDRFKAVMEDHTFAIDPTNPHFKKSKSMAALLDERSRRQHEKASKNRESTMVRRTNADVPQPHLKLQSLVESVKRKSVAMEGSGMGKRRKTS